MFSVSKRLETLDGESVVTQIRQLHDEVGRLTFPRKPNATFEQTVNFTNLLAEDNYDSTLRRNLLDAANGMVAMLFPVGDQGFSLTTPRGIKKTDTAKKYYAECTEEVVYQIRSNSNFLDTVGEATLEWWTFGTCGIYREWSERKERLHFRNLPVNTYAISQNPEGDVDEVYLRVQYSAKDAAKEWGVENLPEVVKEKLERAREGGEESDREEYVVGIFEVHDFHGEEIKKLADGKKWLLIAEHRGTKQRVATVPYNENPFSFGRWSTITGIPWGFSPVWLIIPEVTRLYRLQELADRLGLATLAPPIAAMAKYKGHINRGPLGITYVDDMSEAPQMLQTSSAEYKIGLDRIADAKKDIDAVTYQNFFRLFTGNDDMPETATLARLMDAERSAQLGTPYQRYTTEFFAPQLTGAFKTLYRQGRMPEPPQELVVGMDKRTGQANIPMPGVDFENRLINALKAVENLALTEWFSSVGQVVAELSPEDAQSNFDWQEILRNSFRIAVKNEDYLRPEFEVEEIKKAMAQAQQAQAQMQMAQGAAEVQQKTGNNG